METIILKQESYSYGSCELCKKRFKRNVRGQVYGKGSNGIYFRPKNFFHGDTEKEYIFDNVPQGITLELVKVGDNCVQKLKKN